MLHLPGLQLTVVSYFKFLFPFFVKERERERKGGHKKAHHDRHLLTCCLISMHTPSFVSIFSLCFEALRLRLQRIYFPIRLFVSSCQRTNLCLVRVGIKFIGTTGTHTRLQRARHFSRKKLWNKIFTAKKWQQGQSHDLRCDQIGRFLKILGKKVSYKSIPNVLLMFGLLSNKYLFMYKTCFGYFLSNLWKQFGNFSFQYLVTLDSRAVGKWDDQFVKTVQVSISIKLTFCHLSSFSSIF